MKSSIYFQVFMYLFWRQRVRGRDRRQRPYPWAHSQMPAIAGSGPAKAGAGTPSMQVAGTQYLSQPCGLSWGVYDSRKSKSGARAGHWTHTDLFFHMHIVGGATIFESSLFILTLTFHCQVICCSSEFHTLEKKSHSVVGCANPYFIFFLKSQGTLYFCTCKFKCCKSSQ